MRRLAMLLVFVGLGCDQSAMRVGGRDAGLRPADSDAASDASPIAGESDSGSYADTVATVGQDASVVDVVPVVDADVDAIVWCGEGYHRIVIESSPDVIWCAPIDPATRPKTVDPCGSGRPYGYHEPTGTYWCVGYAGVDARSS